MSYTLRLDIGDKLEINFPLLKELLLKHGYNTSDMYTLPGENACLLFSEPSETYPTSIRIVQEFHEDYLYIGNTLAASTR